MYKPKSAGHAAGQCERSSKARTAKSSFFAVYQPVWVGVNSSKWKARGSCDCSQWRRRKSEVGTWVTMPDQCASLASMYMHNRFVSSLCAIVTRSAVALLHASKAVVRGVVQFFQLGKMRAFVWDIPATSMNRRDVNNSVGKLELPVVLNAEGKK